MFHPFHNISGFARFMSPGFIHLHSSQSPENPTFSNCMGSVCFVPSTGMENGKLGELGFFTHLDVDVVILILSHIEAL